MGYLETTGLLYSGELRVDRLDEESIASMKRAGFTNVIVGLETVSPESVDLYNKGDDDYVQAAWRNIPLLLEHRIIPQLNVLLCHPYEETRQVRRALAAVREFKEFLAGKGFPFFDAPAGTVVINYPSDNYFRVIKDPAFRIVYHEVPSRLTNSVPAAVAEAVGRVPLHAIRMGPDQDARINKIDFCAQVYDLWDDDIQATTRLRVSSFEGMEATVLSSWIDKGIVVRPREQIAVEGDGSYVRQLVGRCLATSETPVSDLASGDIPIPAFVQTLIGLSLQGIVRLERGQTS